MTNRCVTFALCLMLLAGFTAAASGAEDRAGASQTLPILWRTPVCEYRKLGVVVAKVGQRVSETTQDDYMPTVKYRQAFEILSDAAREKGGDAVVFTHNQAVFYTYRGRKTHDPVYIHLRGGAIDLPDDTSDCKLEPINPAELTRRARSGKPVNTSSQDVYGD